MQSMNENVELLIQEIEDGSRQLMEYAVFVLAPSYYI